MPLDTTVKVSVDAIHTSLLDLATATAPLGFSRALGMASGTGANQADRIFHDTRTLTASANEDLDLAGVLTDAFGATLTFARIKTLVVAADAGNTNNVIVGAAATNAFVNWVGAATHTVTVRPGGLLLVAASDATAYAVTVGTGDLLRIANSAGGTSVTYSIVLVGASA
jgi:hypothetical protein